MKKSSYVFNFILISSVALVSAVAFEPQLFNQAFAFFGLRNETASESAEVKPHFPVTPLPHDSRGSSFPESFASSPPEQSFPVALQNELSSSFSGTGFVYPGQMDQAGYMTHDPSENSVYPVQFEGNFPPGGFPVEPAGGMSSPEANTFWPTVPQNEIPVYQPNLPPNGFSPVPVQSNPAPYPTPYPTPYYAPPQETSSVNTPPSPLGLPPHSVDPPFVPTAGYADTPPPVVASLAPMPYPTPAYQEMQPYPLATPATPLVNDPSAVASAVTVPNISANAHDIRVEPKIAELEFLSGAGVLAKVGTELILLCDVMPEVRMRAETVAKERNVPEEAKEEFYKEAERHLLPNILEQKIIFTIYYLDAKTSLQKEQLAAFEGQVATSYDRTEIARLIEMHEVSSRTELDRKLQSYGSSLEREKKDFIRMLIGREWFSQSANLQESSLITQQDMINYYEQNKENLFRHEARARWEELAVLFSQVPDENQAWNMIAEMGNRVVQGEPFADVARKYSHGITASSGGVWDWSHPGSLRSAMIDHAIFSLPPGKLSTIFQDETGFHIIRVVEREGVRYTPFEKVHNELRKGIQEERMVANRKKYDDAVFKKFQISISPKIDSSLFSDEFASQILSAK